MNRSVRTGAAMAGVLGAFALAGCGAITVGSSEDETDDSAAETTQTTEATPSASATSEATDATSSDYTDGTYSATGSYTTPAGGVEEISVTITLADDVVTAVEVTGDPQASESQQYQSEFIDGIADEVVGVDIDDLDVSRVGGSSLTSGGFNEALDEIKAEAAA